MRYLFLLLLCVMPLHAQTPGEYPIRNVPFTKVVVTEGFWQQRLEVNRTATIPHNFQQCEKTGRVDNFLRAAGRRSGNFEGWWFNDSDVYKAIESASYSLATHPDPQLDKYVDDLIAKIAAAQEPDGYLFTPRKTAAPDYKYLKQIGPERWSNLADSHELYDLGHLYEAAVAHYQATGKKTLLNIATKSADMLLQLFGPGKMRYVPGHEEIEIGLVKLWRATGKKEYFDLAKFYLDERGRPEGHKLYGEYSQDHKPVIEQTEAVGHSVRASYLYSGMTDIAALINETAYARALNLLWADVHTRKLYLNGGIGSTSRGEAFGKGYELPNLTAYCETCAAIGDGLWNQRMFQLTGEGKYIDILERTLYNGMISGVALDGKSFFYTNPLESDGRYERKEWYAVACCPPNVARFLPQVPGMAYAERGNQLYVNLFLSSRAEIDMAGQKVIVKQETTYPWQGEVKIAIEPEKGGKEFSLNVRLPGWARNEAMPTNLYRFMDNVVEQPVLKLNGKPVKYTLDRGYAVLQRKWKSGDLVELSLPMPIRRVLSNEGVVENKDKVALQRGPVVYCVEWPDVKGGGVLNLVLDDKQSLEAVPRKDLLGGVTVLKGTAQSLRKAAEAEQVDFMAIPYFAWAHRGKGEMAVWLARTANAARPK